MTPRTPERYFPSITFVLTQAQHSLCLPTYRPSLCLRYHPYARYSPPAQNDTLMTTVDHRGSDLSATGLSLPSIIEEDLDLANLDCAISERQTDSRQPRARRLSTLVIELAFAVRRKLAVIRAKATKRNGAVNQNCC